jgi:hypothetical protein
MRTHGIHCNKKSFHHGFSADPPAIETPPPFLAPFEPFPLHPMRPPFGTGKKLTLDKING